MGEGDGDERESRTTFRLDELTSTHRIERDLAPAPPSPRDSGDDRFARWRRGPVTWDQDRLALITFIALEALAFVLLFFWLGDQQWFRMSDDWVFLTERSATSIDDLLAPHFGHWVTFPVLVYRGLFSLFGFDYRAYLATIIVLHLALVAMLRVVMRRVGVGPWVATLVASMLLLFGTGRDDITWSFQIAFVGAAVFGLGQLLLADHDGSIDRRDWGALAAGAIALQWSGLGVVMVAVVGLSVMVRRGWKPTLFQTAPLVALYLTWYLPHRGQISRDTQLFTDGPYGPGQAVEFVWTGVGGAFRGLGGTSIVGIGLAAVLAAGLALAWMPLSWAERRQRAAMPGAMLVGAIVFLAATGRQRTLYGADHALQSRYLYVVVALVLPALAVGVDAIVRRWRYAAVPIAVLLLAGVPHNVSLFEPAHPDIWTVQTMHLRDLISVVAHSPLADQVPPDTVPSATLAPEVTVGWLLEQKAAGRIPEPTGDTSALEAELPLVLGLAPVKDPASVDVASRTCQDVDGAVELTPKVGDVLSSTGPLAVHLVDEAGDRASPTVTYRFAPMLEVVLPDLHLRVTSADEGPTFPALHLIEECPGRTGGGKRRGRRGRGN